jgi:drug/metabolite transporter (DMT)-like permease
MSNPLLFVICTLIWGSTWISIHFQLGEVHPVLSVGYRFISAVIIMGIYCRIMGIRLALPWHIHRQMIVVGLSIYTLDYCLLYASQEYLISALTALMSASIIYFNVFFRRWLLGKPVRIEVILGALIGSIGVGLVFFPQFSNVEQSAGLWLGIGLAMISFVFAALGNVVSERILDKGADVLPMNFWSMCYGCVFIFSYVFISDIPLVLPTNSEYYWSLLYLTVFGTIIAFGVYMKLVQRVGSDKSAYVVLLYPIVALILSTLFEGLGWHWQGFLGITLLLIGNAIAMGKLSIPTAFKAT